MEIAYIGGFLLGLSLIVGFGPQNLFIVQQGIVGRHRAAAVLACTACDTVLIAAGGFGVGSVLSARPLLLLTLSVIGCLLLLRMAWGSLRGSGLCMTALESQPPPQLHRTIFSAIVVSLANPAAMLDTLVILGSFVGSHPAPTRSFVVLGGVSASGLWFTALCYAARALRGWGTCPRRSRLVNVGSAIGLLWAAAMMMVAIACNPPFVAVSY